MDHEQSSIKPTVALGLKILVESQLDLFKHLGEQGCQVSGKLVRRKWSVFHSMFDDDIIPDAEWRYDDPEFASTSSQIRTRLLNSAVRNIKIHPGHPFLRYLK
jgi:hypothetical protein